MSKYRYPYVPNKAEWKSMVDTEFYHESRNKGRRLTDSEKKAVVRSLKRDLEVNEDKIGIGRRSCRFTRLSSTVGESYGLGVQRKSLGGVSDFDDLYVDFLDYIHRHFDDLNILIPAHHRKNLKNLLLRITSDQLRTLITSLFNHSPNTKNQRGNRPLWDEYKILCSMSQYLFFYMISLGYMRLFSDVDPLKYTVYDYRYDITSYDLYYMNDNYGSVFSSFIKHLDHVPRDDRDPPLQILVLLKISEKSEFSETIESDRKKEILDSAHRCCLKIVDRLVDYGLTEASVWEALKYSGYVSLVNSRPLKDIVYFSTYLKNVEFEASINNVCNNIRLSRQEKCLGYQNHASTLVNYVALHWDYLAKYDGNKNSINDELVDILVSDLNSLDDWESNSTSSHVTFDVPILKSPEGVAFTFSEKGESLDSSSVVSSPVRPSLAVLSNFGFNSSIRPVVVEGFRQNLFKGRG